MKTTGECTNIRGDDIEGKSLFDEETKIFDAGLRRLYRGFIRWTISLVQIGNL